MFPGSFNPFHKGHLDVVNKALLVFDRIILARGFNHGKREELNPLKWLNEQRPKVMEEFQQVAEYAMDGRLNFHYFQGYLTSYLKRLDPKPAAIIRGLRNIQDLEESRAFQYWNEDKGLKIPIFYFITDREYVHMSSSALREISYLDEWEKSLETTKDL